MINLEEQQWRTLFLRKVFAISGLIQGLVWSGLALTCIVVYHIIPSYTNLYKNQIFNQDTSFKDLLWYVFYVSLFDSEAASSYNRTLRPNVFYIFAWLYFGFSLLWFSLSIIETLILFKGRFRPYRIHILLGLGIVTFLNVVLDLILFILALYDFSRYNILNVSYFRPNDEQTDDRVADCAYELNMDSMYRYFIGPKMVYGIVAVWAGRGFVLWMFNCFICVYSITVAVIHMHLPLLMQYHHTIPRPKLQTPTAKNMNFDKDFDFLYTLPLGEQNRNHMRRSMSFKARF
ncbi:hypothetical protein ABEB36_001937 [Hypothenemus hampei]|uniref:Uncharacterized protein n=1 Tax=Hypothenemus hampei TaxID=57062 RepID=A0ABD1FG69_HYPHA